MLQSKPAAEAGLSGYPSPNFGPRRFGALPDLVVLHFTAMPDVDEARARLCDPLAEVSAHYLISGAGEVTALVPEELRAWHAGAGAWGLCRDINSQSIGIELANTGDQPFAGAQMAALERLLSDILHRWQIPPERVIGHSDMAPDRKLDPGRRFDWRRLAMSGLAVWPSADLVPGEADAAQFRADLRAFGYPEASDEDLLLAFRLRFLPWAQGALSARDCAIAADIALRFPVDAPHPGA